MMILSKTTEQDAKEFITGLRNFLRNDAETMAETIETKFPELFS